jgi:hypothetical protein
LIFKKFMFHIFLTKKSCVFFDCFIFFSSVKKIPSHFLALFFPSKFWSSNRFSPLEAGLQQRPKNLVLFECFFENFKKTKIVKSVLINFTWHFKS